MNTEVKHTPGPWDFEPSGKEAGYIGFPDGSGFYAAIREDDGHLIASAPDLFEALDLARRYMKTCLGSSFWDGPNPHPIIDAALAKARGEVNA